MLIGHIKGATRVLGAPPGWDQEAIHCSGLPVVDTIVEGEPVMTSAWLPTPEEMDLLKQGAPVYLSIFGRGHPPVMVTVGQP